jgi:hypothetical protein
MRIMMSLESEEYDVRVYDTCDTRVCDTWVCYMWMCLMNLCMLCEERILSFDNIPRLTQHSAYAVSFHELREILAVGKIMKICRERPPPKALDQAAQPACGQCAAQACSVQTGVCFLDCMC